MIKLVTAYIFAVLALLTGFVVADAAGLLPDWYEPIRLPVHCAVAGGFGGVVYCLRSIYFRLCVTRDWDDAWAPWYFIRPVVSAIFGAASFLFLRAGLLSLGASQNSSGGDYGFLALAFVAGLNVDRFMRRIEGIGQSTWGVEPTRLGGAITSPDEREADQ